MTKHKHGRSGGDGHFYQVYEWFLRSTAWQHANVYERAVYHELKRRYNGRNNGEIPLSHREAMALINSSNTVVEKAFAGLQCKGFIKPQQKGSFNWKTAEGDRSRNRSTRWTLTELPQDVPARVLSGGTKEFMSWVPGLDFSEKSAARSHRANGPLTSGHSDDIARSRRAIEEGVTAHVGR